MNSDERRVKRRANRERKRAENRARRIEPCTIGNVADIDNLYDSARIASHGKMWKTPPQRYMRDHLGNAVRAHRALLAGESVCLGYNDFTIWERGKLRNIKAPKFPEVVVQKSLTKNALLPAIVPTLVHANSANIKGKGTDFALKLLKRQMADHYRKHGADGYILQVDFKDYFARIQHKPLYRILDRALDDPDVVALARQIIDAQGDVGLGLGSEPNQILAVALPSALDHFVLEMLGVEAYGRYMDDSYCIHADKEWLHVCLEMIRWKCGQLGITLNERKTRITKLTRGFVFLKKRFFYGENGKVVVTPCRETVTRKRRKLRKLHGLYLQGRITFEQVHRAYQATRGGLMEYDSHDTLLSYDRLFKELFGGCPEYAEMLKSVAGGGTSKHRP